MKNTYPVNIIPENDSRRVEALKRYGIFNTPNEPAFDNIAKLAKTIFNVPIAHISFLDAEHEFVKAGAGLPEMGLVDRGESMCALTVLQPEVLVVENALTDPLFDNHPFVHGDFGLRFYAGAPIITPDKYIIGTMCLVDREPRSLTAHEVDILRDLAGVVMEQVELRLSNKQQFKRQSETNEQLNLAVEAANLGIWHIEPETKALQYNAMLARIFGYEGEQPMTYQQAIDQVTDEYRGKILREIEEAIRYGGDYDITYRQSRFNDGEIIWLRSTGKISQDAAGSYTVFSGIVMEITRQKKDEQRKNDFIGMVSHELKTPLTSLTAIIQVLHGKLKQTEDSFVAGALDRANRQVKKMGDLINGFLNISRLESGKIHLDKKDFRLDELVESIVSETRLTTSGQQISFIPSASLTINADPEKIGSVIANLLNNAVKYSAKETEIRVTCVKKGNKAEVSIHDQGIGIKPEHIKHLFDRYYRVENPNFSHISGFGIGLYLSSEIIRQHEGRIWVKSEYGKGSTFYFSVPVQG